MTSVVVQIPVLGRPQRVKPLLESLEASRTPGIRMRAWFICSPGDDEEIAAVKESGADFVTVRWEPGPGDWAKKHNHAFRHNFTFDWVLLAADDLEFHPGWAEAAIRTGTSRRVCVVGTNDLGNARVIAGHHSTHPLVHRDYGECGVVDDPSKLLCELYDHQFVDDEFVHTAMARGTFAPAYDSYVEHLHPVWGKGEPDATYEKGQSSFWEDKVLFESRKHLWEQLMDERLRGMR